MKYQQRSRPKKPVFVGSVFAGTDQKQEQLLKLQLGYLKATTRHFHYFITISDHSTSYFGDVATILPTTPNWPRNDQHRGGLIALLNYAKAHINDYSGFLFLDSDAFPIKPWQKILRELLGGKHIAAPLRTEYLETASHVSVIYCRKQAIRRLEFVLAPMSRYKSRNLTAACTRGRGACMMPFEIQPAVMLPLIKSNRHDLYPVLCTVYSDLFYHHTYASHTYEKVYDRGPFKYWSIVTGLPPPDPNEVWAKLMEDPHKFISNLAGWGPYPEPLI